MVPVFHAAPVEPFQMFEAVVSKFYGEKSCLSSHHPNDYNNMITIIVVVVCGGVIVI